ncbi:hypothetical protein [Candidatus Kryptobacter tengchongensis]|uniref:Uncharacterized protein n=3 Tax=Kryptobacter tengchongensis TaxID=1643429 RepID=A0A656D618_KRYT1|nr:hypothetical protein [Candidatus Kryptobacter tengchongensis]CUT00712.1 hypothetical protein JGI24_00818 [Candidatus Kryptobacter tengchongensis]
MEDREKQVENISTNGGQPLEDIYKDIIDVEYFNEVVVGAYNRG